MVLGSLAGRKLALKRGARIHPGHGIMLKLPELRTMRLAQFEYCVAATASGVKLDGVKRLNCT